MFIAETIIPNSLNKTFDYIIPEELVKDLQIGMRVAVDFANKKNTTAIVLNIHEHDDTIDCGYRLKEVASLIDSLPSFTSTQLKLWQQIAAYYQCSLGDIFKNETPSLLKVSNDSYASINPQFEIEDYNNLSSNEISILNSLKDNNPKLIKNIAATINIKNISVPINKLIQKNAIFVSDKVNDRYKPKFETYVYLSPNIISKEQITDFLDSLSKAKKQLNILESFLSSVESNELNAIKSHKIRKNQLLSLANANSSQCKELIKKDILVETEIATDRININYKETASLATLTTAQKHCLGEIQSAFHQDRRVLLHGVAYSGKTEIYSHLIQDCVNREKQVLLLVPENALTTQLAQRLAPIFGQSLAVYNNKISQFEQIEIWNKVITNEKYKIIIGTKSSVFLPFKDLGLIIVDEEHDQNYKKADKNPRYHARNAALLLSKITKSNLILGSATPSLESYTNSLNNKLCLVSLNERFNNITKPSVRLINMSEVYKNKTLKGHYSLQLINAIEGILKDGKQIILLQNRRGYASFIECKHCGYVPKCPNCNVSLSVHKNTNALKCHYCNHTISLIKQCPSCKSDDVSYKGFGSEQAEIEASELFPNAVVKRMDIDTMTGKNSYNNIINEFNNRNIDILVGTQMVAKGLDFDNVALVGILNADNMLYFPDFRAFEYAYQLIEQTAGRCGRGVENGIVMIQTSNPEHPIFKHIVSGNYFQFFAQQMSEREAFKYPPYYRLIKLTTKHQFENINTDAANTIAHALRNSFGDRILGPDSPIIERINNQYIKNIIIKIELTADISRAKSIIADICQQIRQNKRFGNIIISIDIDPI